MNKLISLALAAAILAPAVVHADTAITPWSEATGYVLLSGGVTSEVGFGGRATAGLPLTERLNLEASLDVSRGLLREANAVTVGGRMFFTDHINVSGGAAWRLWRSVPPQLLTDDTVIYQGYELSLELNLGTQWRFGRASLGVDWCGVSVPVADLGGDIVTRRRGRIVRHEQLDEAGSELVIRVLYLQAGLAF